MKLLFDLFLTFFKIGIFTFGGGYAMISIIEDSCVRRKKWISEEEMMDITILAESTPGPIAINCATFVGYKQKGFIGSIIATLGIITPSFVIIFAISKFFDNFLEIPIIANALKGIKVAVGILIFNVALNMIKKTKKTGISIIVMVISFIIMLMVDLFSLQFSTISLMLTVGAISLAVCFVQSEMKKKGQKNKK